MLDKIFILVLILNLTGLYYFIASQFNIALATVSLVLLGLNCIYIAVNYEITSRLFQKKHIFYWFLFLLLWPLLATSYAPAINFRELGLQVYYFTLLLATIAYLLKNGFKLFQQIITIACIITIIGLILSMFMSHLIQINGSTEQLNIRYQGRAYGFFMQPNIAAMNLNLLFIVWFAGLRKNKPVAVFLSLFGLCVFIILTGSRSGFVMAVAVISLIFINRGVKVIKPFTVLISLKSIIVLLLVVGCFLACIPLLLSFLTAQQPKHVDDFDIVARVKAISQMKLTERSSEGKSTIARRVEHFKHYLDMISEHPILGSGFGSTTIFQANGILGRSSHNQYLKIAFETGMLRLTLYLLLLFSIYMHPGRKRIEQFLHTNSYAQLLIVMILAGMVSNVVLDSRVLYCALGCFITMLIYPQTVAADNAFTENAPNPKCTNNIMIHDEK